MLTRRPMLTLLEVLLVAWVAAGPAPAGAAAIDPALTAAIASPERLPAAVARDPVRHPAEELTFFGLAANQTVVELWPGGGYWTDILGPYLAAHGHFYAVLGPASDADEASAAVKWRARYATRPERYGTIIQTTLGPGQFDIAPPGSADLVVTFRNLHNWMDGGYAPQALAACFRALKPGGILASRSIAAAPISRRTRRRRTATCARTIRSRWPSRRVSSSSGLPRCSRIRATPRIGSMASGPCRPRSRRVRRIAIAIWRSVKLTISCSSSASRADARPVCRDDDYDYDCGARRAPQDCRTGRYA